jgi:hypothetical protein
VAIRWASLHKFCEHRARAVLISLTETPRSGDKNMSVRIFSAALVALAVSSGGAFAGDRGRMAGAQQPEATGSVSRSAEPLNLFGVPERDPRLVAPERQTRSTFNANTARARHYER